MSSQPKNLGPREADGPPKAVVAVIEDDAATTQMLSVIFRKEDCQVISADSGEAGIRLVLEQRPDVVLLDMHLPGMNGLSVLEILRRDAPRIPVVMMTGDDDLKNVVRATRLGAYDYVAKPFARVELIGVVHRAIETQSLRNEVEELRHRTAPSLTMLMGESPQVRKIAEQVELIAASDLTALVLGETGTGKEVVAQAIHRASRRRDHPFVALDCGAIPEALLESELFGHERGSFTGADRKKQGQFQLADGGTVFLDEVGNLPASLQPKLLRVLESMRVTAVGAERATLIDVRFVAATNEDLKSRVAAGQFRADLYFRLAQYPIILPPLRTRPSDIAHLAKRFLEEARIELRRPVQEFAPEAMALLAEQSWPGNVRQLRNVVRQAVLHTQDFVVGPATVRDLLAREHAPESPQRGARRVESTSTDVPNRSLKEIAEEAARNAEREAILRTLRQTGGNKSEAARLLRTDYKTLHVKAKALGIDARELQDDSHKD